MDRGVWGEVRSDDWQQNWGSHPQVFESPAAMSTWCSVSVIDKTTCGSLYIHFMRDFSVSTLRKSAQRDPTGCKGVTYWWQVHYEDICVIATRANFPPTILRRCSLDNPRMARTVERPEQEHNAWSRTGPTHLLGKHRYPPVSTVSSCQGGVFRHRRHEKQG
ncbi:hypothetical protein EI94DRAFT_952253 [Lactarius quietus]|nr:hypothetical protein EI94DRAFT_952253 [Lactarius quietus]